MSRKKLPRTVYLTQEQDDAVRALHEKGVPFTAVFRDAVDLVVTTHPLSPGRPRIATTAFEDAQIALDMEAEGFALTPHTRKLAKHVQWLVAQLSRREAELQVKEDKISELRQTLYQVKRAVKAALGEAIG